ncbi:unnamed protein product [Closterium sp. NIES-53]
MEVRPPQPTCPLLTAPFMLGRMLYPLSPPHSHLHRPQPRTVQGKNPPAGNHLGTGHPVSTRPATSAAAGDGGSTSSAGAAAAGAAAVGSPAAAAGAAGSPAAAAAATGGSAGSAAAAAAPGPQYLHLPTIPYAMPGMPPMGMWQWLPQPDVESSHDQKLRTLVV